MPGEKVSCRHSASSFRLDFGDGESAAACCNVQVISLGFQHSTRLSVDVGQHSRTVKDEAAVPMIGHSMRPGVQAPNQVVEFLGRQRPIDHAFIFG
jgi:hypothetical protein